MCETTRTTNNNGTTTIRRLGLVENYFHGEIEKCSSINTNTILFKSKFELFNQIPLLNRAIRLWMRTQPFLRCRVDKRTDGNYFTHVDFDLDEDATNLPNVSYLHCKGTGDLGKNDYWKMLIEREITIPIDWQRGPMWRLIFVDLNQRPSSTSTISGEHKYEYCLLISVSHALFDGLSAFATLATLFLIIQELFDGSLNESEIVDAPVVDSVENYVSEFLQQQGLTSRLAPFQHARPFKTPRHLVMSDPLSERVAFNPTDVNNNPHLFNDPSLGFYSALDDQLVIKLSDLARISDQSVTKFHMTTFGGQQFRQFLNRCKLHKAKVNSTFNLIFILAWRMVYQAMGGGTGDATIDQLREKINYTVLVNLRPYVNNMDMSLLLWFCNFMYCTFDAQVDVSAEDFWRSRFWQICRDESETFHARLRNLEMFRLYERAPVVQHDEVRVHYGLSNLVVPTELINEIRLFKLDELYTLSSYRRDWTSDLCYNSMINIDGEVCWTLYYNSYFVKKQTIDLFLKYVIDIYNKLSL